MTVTTDPYQIATTEAGLIEPSQRTWITVRGPDARKFLNNLFTNNIQSLKKGVGCYTLLCTPKGKVLSDLFCYDNGDSFGIDADIKQREFLFTALKKYIVFNKVELIDESEKWKRTVLIGPKAKDISPPPTPLPQGEGEYLYFPLPRWERGGGEGVMKIYKIWWELPWIEIWSQKEIKIDLPKIPCDVQEILRIESKTPLLGIDMNEETIPQEAGLKNALHFNKGCYMGQETITRLQHRGHVGKELALLKLNTNTLPARGEKIFSEKGEESGWVTSSCHSLKYNSVIAMGYLRYAFLKEMAFHIANSSAERIP